MKFKTYNHSRGITFEISIEKYVYYVYFDSQMPTIDIIEQHNSAKLPHVLFEIDNNDCEINKYIYLVNGSPRIKSRKINKIKNYFTNLIVRISKLGAFS